MPVEILAADASGGVLLYSLGVSQDDLVLASSLQSTIKQGSADRAYFTGVQTSDQYETVMANVGEFLYNIQPSAWRYNSATGALTAVFDGANVSFVLADGVGMVATGDASAYIGQHGGQEVVSTGCLGDCA